MGVFAAAFAVVLSSFVAVAPAQADVSPPAGTPATVTADSLPTVQINGIVWDQAVVGNTVFAAGKFTSARPAGAAAGTSETPRSNLLAYDVTTGTLITSFAPSINAQVRQVEASPDGTRLYIVGDFTTVNGQTRNRVAAFDLPSGTLSTTFNPNSNGVTSGVAATNDTVYLTGTFGRIAGNDRSGAAAVTRAGALLPWAPVLEGRQGKVVVVSPDGTKVALGGNFQTLNGSSNPGYGLAMVSAADASLLPFQTNNVVRNAGLDAAILSLKSDGAGSFYGTGYVYGSGGNLEGSFRSSWADGSLVWVNDCHGDQYDVQPMGDAVYAAGHSHYCGSLKDGFPQSNPWTFYRGIAVTNEPARVTPFGLNLGYFDFGGNPAPALLHWFPSFNTGTVSGASQGPWSVNGNSEYLVYGGEFTRVNNTGQQGLARFAVSKKSTNAQGPLLWNTAWPATAVALSGGAVRVSWPLNYDRDSEFLKYEVLRNNVVVKTLENVRSKSPDWGLPPMAYVDAAVTNGASYTYRIRATDPEGHSILGGSATATATGTSTTSAYRSAVLADSPLSYWPLDDDSATTSYDWAGATDLTVNSGVTRGAPGAILGETRAASRFDGSSTGFASTTQSIAGPDSFGIEAWIKTTTTAGGKIVGFGNSSTGTSSNYDRHIYMEPDGRITFGVYPGSSQTITSSESFNDGQWHQISAGLSSSGMVLYVDGVRVAQRSDVTSAQPYNGFWRVGGDSPWSGAAFFDGVIDEVAVYGAPLSRQQVASHYIASGRTLEGSAPPADPYGASVYALQPTLYWRLGETAGTTADDASGSAQRGTYYGSVTQGSAGALSGVSDTSVTFQGGQVVSKSSFVNPRTYSLQAWFKTSTTTGGKIIGFGNSPNGDSSAYDRQVYMTPDGRLIFGVWVGFTDTLQTDPGLNDGLWHQVVATQGPEGMRLYVDGVLRGSNSQSNAQDYTGYWHAGGDVTWGPGDWAFDGQIDEVAVYPTPLGGSDVAQSYALGATGAPANNPPTASFTSSPDKLAVAVDGSASSDVDGTVAAYSWSWGDGTLNGTGATATHTYAAAGIYTVTLTVTDDDGATAQLQRAVTVVANQAPVASFTTTVTDLTVATNAGGSADGDGAIMTYAWDWGDGSVAGSGSTATHAYAATGSFTITLTVTDDDGTTATKAIPVTVTAPVGGTTYANDSFNRTLAAGLGAADNGGAWTLSNSTSSYRVDGDRGVFVQAAGSAQRYAYLTGVSSTDTAVDVDVTLPQRPVGGSSYFTVHARRVGTSDYKTRVIVTASGAVTVQLQQTGVTLTNVTTSLNVAAGDTVHVRTEAVGTSPTTLRTKVWKVGTTEPAGWTSSTTDATAALQAPGHVGIGVYLGGGVTNVPFETRFDNFWAGSSVAPPPTNIAPSATFTATPTDLAVAVDASASRDPDGTVASYAWDFGDGDAGTGATASHTYAAAGTYSVKLTVLDDKGAAGTLTQTVTVTAPVGPVNTPPTASFTATPTDLAVAFDGSASRDTDGTVASYAWDFGDGDTGAGATASHTYAAAGTYSVKLTVLDDKGAAGTFTSPVVVTVPAGAVFAADGFDRASGTALGGAVSGGAWAQTAGVANVSIDGAKAKLTTQAAGQTRSATLNSATATSTDLTFNFAITALPVGGRLYVSALGRVVGADDYRARWLIAGNGSVQAQLARGGTALSVLDLPGLVIVPGAVYNVRAQVDGVGTTTLRSKIWTAGSAEPSAWQLSTTDTTVALQAAGFPGFTTYAGSGFTSVPYSVSFDDFLAKGVGP